MRVVFFGTPEFAVPTLQRLLESAEFEIVGIVTQPDAKRARGNQTTPTPVKAIALAHNLDRHTNISIWTPERLKKDTNTLQALANSQADVFVVVAYGQILSQAILDMPKSGCINVHGSLLPKYRGAAPIQWAIANGETTMGITTMQMDAGIDTGDMLLKASLEVSSTDQAESMGQKLAVLGADLLIETLQNLDKIAPIPQDSNQFTYAPTIPKELWQLDWTKSAIALHNQIRGFYPNCYTNSQNQRLKITITEVISEHSPQATGIVVDIRKNVGFTIQTGDGLLLIKEVQPAGKRSQTGWDFVNGTKLKINDKFG
jgi:methionyl-tRNA formyltransferase